MKSYESQNTHKCRFEEPSYAICEDMAVIVKWRCDYQPGSTVTDHGRDESYFAPSGPRCDRTRHVRFDLDHTVYRGKRCDGDWTQWSAGRDDSYSVLNATEFDPQTASDHPRVTECDVAWTPDGPHGPIVLQTATKHGNIAAVYEVTR